MRASSGVCRLCSNQLAPNVLDLGVLPACNGYSREPSAGERRPFRVGECSHCGLVQLLEDTPVTFLRPRVPWIKYNEPDGHLDQVAEWLAGATGERPANAIGLGPFDRTMLDRLGKYGFRTRWSDLLGGAELTGEFPYLETAQQQLRTDRLASLFNEQRPVELVTCRYLLEHSHDPIASLRALASLVTASGRVVVEVPDSSKFLSRGDYCFLWEEHIAYFTEETLGFAARAAGLEVEAILRFEGPLEDALVAVLRRPGAPVVEPGVLSSRPFADYQRNFSATRDRYDEELTSLGAGGGRAAMIGVGHQAVMFLNGLELQGHFGYMIDDDPNKQGLFVPGSTCRIVSTTELLDATDISVCLLAVSPQAEVKIRQRLRPLLDRGTQMFSIFAGGGSPNLMDGKL